MAQNFCATFKIGQKMPQKASERTDTLKKLPKIAQNFYIFPKAPKKSYRNTPDFFTNSTEPFRFC
jgi:hypothetical protein